LSDSGTGSAIDWVSFFDRGGFTLLEGLTADVVGPADDADGVETAGAAGLVPVHPTVGCAVSGFDFGGEGGCDVGGSDVLDGGGECEGHEESGEKVHEHEFDGRHRDVCRGLG